MPHYAYSYICGVFPSAILIWEHEKLWDGLQVLTFLTMIFQKYFLRFNLDLKLKINKKVEKQEINLNIFFGG